MIAYKLAARFIDVHSRKQSMFTIDAQQGQARTGTLTVKSGKTITTPFFMPVCTKGTVKMLTSKDLLATSTQAIISNAFILSIRPGLDVIKKFGGIHEFIDWPGISFTDSGGFQMLQPNFLLGVGKRGIHFRNPFDKNKMVFTPEACAVIQEAIGSDVAMILDDVVHYGQEYDRMALAIMRTQAWTKRFLITHTREKQLVFGINQGGTFADLRRKSSQLLAELDIDGYAIGGLGIGESREQMLDMIDVSIEELDPKKPRYLMGVGSPLDIIESVAHGIDIFDSRFPTMNARHGRIFTRKGFLDIKKAKHRDSELPLDENCTCRVCATYSRAFIRHLLTTDERTGHQYTSFHNVFFIQQLMTELQQAIAQGQFDEYRQQFLVEWHQ
ncbi:tRNA guanosine(34) transglycosylase Tgt [Candidatus Woesearchaeota archaeon]|nr:tRNA guanosine(34) transglycosylase Tgt [Candidatus Woesearchaeota archaeon]